MQRHVDTREVAPRGGNDLEARDAPGRIVPQGLDAQKRERLREILAAGANRRAAPEVEHQRARPVAVLARMARHHLLRSAPPDVVSAARRRMARIDAKEIAPRGQHVLTTARRRAGRAGLDETPGERGEQRRHFRLRASLPHRLAAFGSAEDMQPVADAKLLHVAKPGVEARERFRLVRRAGGAAFLRKSATLRLIEDRTGDALRATRIERGGLSVFIEHLLEPRGVVIELRVLKRRRHMADRHGGEAALRLRRLARIIDDEGIDHRRRPEQRLRRAIRREHHRFAGQELQRAMRAEMDQRIHAVMAAQPEIKGDIGVARRGFDVVIALAAFRSRAAVGLESHDELPALDA